MAKGTINWTCHLKPKGSSPHSFLRSKTWVSYESKVLQFDLPGLRKISWSEKQALAYTQQYWENLTLDVMPAGWLPWVMINTVTNIDTLRKFVALKFRRYKLNLKVIPNLKLSGFTFRTFKLLSARRLSECSKERAAANNNWLCHEVKLASKRRQPPVQELFLRRRSTSPQSLWTLPLPPPATLFPPKKHSWGAQDRE